MEKENSSSLFLFQPRLHASPAIPLFPQPSLMLWPSSVAHPGLLLPLPPALSSFSSTRPILAPDGLVPTPLALKQPAPWPSRQRAFSSATTD